ncbi:MAG: CoB--CoM heterodisulfide reductase iron-sulfur subunit B family protein [Smithellaceae bacterium]|nr:CoB--CoM heterodisulfide reductase iron-sulfur subunit B family protein [Smithellaceae bacterium]MDD3258922.1 CoB--CoM heterodisulfide reductase iron-sulfur subunit B family protein [Smithellaceae bacterium]MDD3847885.1 CoB--CoM heterodisulfide reductase iron-sulfur subunit B family protein [Smithellaceae bacterium]HOG13004.1 CoB--CoM heterodisulfide reductase iron-sulfur subunit B family protein [Smithellaceae bacterium]HOQ72644.1 CoB--CoM heterodisulfide reductase iron-sulfur subunit B fam
MKVSYYPGCSLHAMGKEYDQSMKAVSRALNIELKEVDDWSCCGASAAHNTNFDLSIALPARNLIAAEKDAMDVMVPCAACFNRFKMAEHHLKSDKDLKARIEGVLGARYQGGISIRNPIDVIYNEIGIDALAAKVVKPMTGLKPVSYYGCLLLRPPEVCQFENYENPFMLDKMMGALGADVKNWSYKTDCCGGSLSVSKTPIVVAMCDKLMAAAREAGANCVVTACPMCMANLEMRPSPNMKMPVFYFTELISLAMGLPGSKDTFNSHLTDPQPLLNQLRLI